MNNVLASVIVPCYNVEKYIEHSVEAILHSTYEKLELILVDDGSTDSTWRKIEELKKEDSRVQAFHTTNHGVSDARNFGISKATGKYIYFVDPDDLPHSDMIEKTIIAMEQTGADYCVFNFHTEVEGDYNGNVLMRTKLKEHYSYNSKKDILDKYFPKIFGYSIDDINLWYKGEKINTNKEFGSVWRCVYLRKIIKDNNIKMDPHIILNEDSMFNCEYMLHCNKMISIQEPLYTYYLKNEGAMTKNSRSKTLIKNKYYLLKRRNAIANSYRMIRHEEPIKLYVGSCVFSIFEMMINGVESRLDKKELLELIGQYMDDSEVRKAIKLFPIKKGRTKYTIPIIMLKHGKINMLYNCFSILSKIGYKVNI